MMHGRPTPRHALAGAVIAFVLLAVPAVAMLGGGAAPAWAAGSTAAPGSAGARVSCVPRPVPLPATSGLTDVHDVAQGRLRTYTMTSPAVGVTHVNVLLPVGYDAHSARRYPVLYLLHGALGSYADWASTKSEGGEPQGGNAEALVASSPIIVVMPDDSQNGSYTDWFGISTGDAAMHPVPAAPAWETFHIGELIPWVDSTFSTQADAGGRAIAGLSSGGGGAAKYASGNPGLFGYVGMFSGALDNDLVDSTINTYSSGNSLSPNGSPDQRCTFGDPNVSDAGNSAYYWYGNDPTYDASNLTGIKLFVTSGNGTPTAADAKVNPIVRSVQGDIERVVDDESHHFVTAVQQAGLGANLTTDFYGNGVHAWSYWQRDLTAFLRWLTPRLDPVLAPPASFSFRTERASANAWGWSFRHQSGLAVANVNTAEEFVYLTHVSASGLTAAGDGTLDVTTPRGSYPPGSSHEVVTGPVTTTVKADTAGELSFRVVLGAPALRSQFAFPAAGAPAHTPTVTMSIASMQPLHAARRGSHRWLALLGIVIAALVALAIPFVVRRRAAR